MLANIKKKLSFIILSIISIFIFSSCSKEDIEVRDLKLNENVTVEFEMSKKEEDLYFFYFKFYSEVDQICFVKINKYKIEHYVHGSRFYICDKLSKLTADDIEKENVPNLIYDRYYSFNKISEEHSFKLIDDDTKFFGTFKAEKQKEYYLIYVANNIKLEPVGAKFDLLVYDYSICDVKPTVINNSLVYIDPKFGYSVKLECMVDNDYRLVEFTALKQGLYSFSYNGSILIDYCKEIPKGFSFEGVICTYYINYNSEQKKWIPFEISLEENETVYFRLRKDDFSKFYRGEFSINYIQI